MSDENSPELPARWRGSNERSVRLPKQQGNERREAARYPLELGLRYAVLRVHKGAPETGTGHTIDVSSSGLRFLAERPIAPGLQVQLFVDWPLALDGGVQLQLIASGSVVWSKGNETALTIQRHEFRTRGRGLKLA